MNSEQKVFDNLSRIKESIRLKQDSCGLKGLVTLVGVTKTQTTETIITAINAGLTNIGENRIQEASAKFKKIKFCNNITKHMIGHLQSNKVKKAIEIFDRIDSIDSKKLANKINVVATAQKKTIPTLLEINTSDEKEKYGFSVSELDEILTCFENNNLIIEGLMTVGPHTKNKEKIRKAFSSLRYLLDKINKQLPTGHTKLSTLSMGMSGDYLIGVEEGSTMVRIGTAIFGPRQI